MAKHSSLRGVLALAVVLSFVFASTASAERSVGVLTAKNLSVVCSGRAIENREITSEDYNVPVPWVEPSRRRSCTVRVRFTFHASPQDPYRRVAVVLQRLFMGAGQIHLRHSSGPSQQTSTIRPRYGFRFSYRSRRHYAPDVTVAMPFGIVFRDNARQATITLFVRARWRGTWIRYWGSKPFTMRTAGALARPGVMTILRGHVGEEGTRRGVAGVTVRIRKCARRLTGCSGFEGRLRSRRDRLMFCPLVAVEARTDGSGNFGARVQNGWIYVINPWKRNWVFRPKYRCFDCWRPSCGAGKQIPPFTALRAGAVQGEQGASRTLVVSIVKYIRHETSPAYEPMSADFELFQCRDRRGPADCRQSNLRLYGIKEANRRGVVYFPRLAVGRYVIRIGPRSRRWFIGTRQIAHTHESDRTWVVRNRPLYPNLRVSARGPGPVGRTLRCLDPEDFGAEIEIRPYLSSRSPTPPPREIVRFFVSGGSAEITCALPFPPTPR